MSYSKDTNNPYRVESEIFDFNGQKVVCARRMTKTKAGRVQGLYAVSALSEYKEKSKHDSIPAIHNPIPASVAE